MRLFILSALICAINCKPEGYYRQEYQFKKSSSSYKNNQLETQENDEGFYKKQGDLEGKAAPTVDQHNEHQQFSNPDLTGQGHTITTYDDRDLTPDAERAFSKLGGINGLSNGQSRSYSYANSYQTSGQRAVPTYTTQSNLRQITHNLQQDMSQQLQEACRHLQSQSYYSSEDVRILENELKANLTRQLQEALRTRYGTQGSQGASSYSIVNGGYNSNANYDNQELTDLSKQVEQNLLKQLHQTMQTTTSTYSQSSSNQGRTTGWNSYPIKSTGLRRESAEVEDMNSDNTQQRVYRPYDATSRSNSRQTYSEATGNTNTYQRTNYRPEYSRPSTQYIPSNNQRQEPIHQTSYTPSYSYQPNLHIYRPSSYTDDFPQINQTTERVIVRPSVSVTDVLHNVQNDISKQINEAVRNYESRYTSTSFALTDSRPDFQSILKEYRRELQNNITIAVLEALNRNYGPQIRRGEYSFSSGSTNTANYRIEDLDSLRQQLEINLNKHLEDNFRNQETRYQTRVQQQSAQNRNYNQHGPTYTAPLTDENYRYNQRSYSSSSSVNTELGNIGNQVQQDLSRQLNAAVQKQQGYSSSSNQANFNELTEELKRNLTRNLEEKLREHYGSQGMRGGYSYTVSASGVLNPKANYNADELSALTQQLQEDLNRQLNEQISRRESSYSQSSSISSTGGSGNYYQPTRYTPSSGYNSGLKTHGSQGFQKYSSFSSGSMTAGDNEDCTQTQTRKKRHAYSHDLSQQIEDDYGQQPENVFSNNNYRSSSYSQHYSNQYGAVFPPQANPATAYHSTNFHIPSDHNENWHNHQQSQSGGFEHHLHPDYTSDQSEDYHSTGWHQIQPSISSPPENFQHLHHHPYLHQSADDSQHFTQTAEWLRLHPNSDYHSFGHHHGNYHSQKPTVFYNEAPTPNPKNPIQHTTFVQNPIYKPKAIPSGDHLGQQAEEDIGQRLDDVYGQNQDLSQQTEDDFGKLETGQHDDDQLTQQNENIFGQQTEDDFGQFQFGQQTDDRLTAQQNKDQSLQANFAKTDGKLDFQTPAINQNQKPTSYGGSTRTIYSDPQENPTQKPLNNYKPSPTTDKPNVRHEIQDGSIHNFINNNKKIISENAFEQVTPMKPNVAYIQRKPNQPGSYSSTNQNNEQSQQTEDDFGQLELGQQTEDDWIGSMKPAVFGPNNDPTGQTEDGFGKLELGQQTEDNFGQLNPIVYIQRKPKQADSYSSANQYNDLTQQTEDDFGQLELGQQTEDHFGQLNPIKPNIVGQNNHLTQQTEDGFGKLELGQNIDDGFGQLELGQQIEDDFGPLNPIKPHVVGPNNHLTQQTEDGFGKLELEQQTEDNFGQLELGQQTEDDFVLIPIKTNVVGQNSDPTQQTEDGFGKLELEPQSKDDFEQQLNPIKPNVVQIQRKPNQSGSYNSPNQNNDLTQQIEDDFGQFQIGQQTEDNFGQQTDDNFQQVQQISSHLFIQRNPNRATGNSYAGSLDLTQQTENQFNEQTQQTSYGGYRRLPQIDRNVQMMETNLDFLNTDQFVQQNEEIFQNLNNHDSVAPISLADAHSSYINRPQYANAPQEMHFFINAENIQREHDDNLNQQVEFQEPQMVNQHTYSNFGNQNGDDASSEGIEEDVNLSVAPKHYNQNEEVEVPGEEIVEATETAPVGFWKKVGGKITKGFNAVKEKTKDLAEKINLG